MIKALLMRISASKVAADQLALQAAASDGTPIVLLYPGVIYGPGKGLENAKDVDQFELYLLIKGMKIENDCRNGFCLLLLDLFVLPV
ncbi:hypothetical protein RIF29_12733 [Crotalaria pallida]|uniref:Uncharacterized protein n=1 Tax=Crotalaria pallida TaxID=3830 RepID=A0AAN9INL8_CROPI